MTLNVSQLNQIGGLLQEVNPDGSANNAATQQLLAQVLQQLGGNFTQTTVSDDLHTHFVAAGGFGMQQLVMIVAAIVVSILTYGAASAAIGATLGAAEGSTFAAAAAGMSAGLGNVALSAGIAGLASSVTSQVIGTGRVNWGSAFEAAGVAAVTAGLTNGITYNSSTGLGFATQPMALNGATQSLASLAGVNPAIGNNASRAFTSTATQLETRGLAILGEATLSAGVQTAIEGGSFGNALKGAVVSDAAAAAAFAIGDGKQGLVQDLGEGGGEFAYLAEHAALGCAVGAASGQGCGGGAIGGAASAAFSPDLLKAIDPTGAALSPGQQAAMAGFATLLGGGLAGLAGANAQGGATAAQNEVLNNTDDHPETAAKNGGVLSTLGGAFVDALKATNNARGWVQSQVDQFIGLMNANSGQTPPSDPNPLVQANDGNPPNTGASPVTPAVPVCDPPVCTVMPGSPGTPGYAPGNTTLSSGDSNGSNASNDTATTTRPSWRQSEIDVGSDLGSDARPQVSYLNGVEVPNGTPGSVRPDLVATDGSASFEVKNYNIATNSSGLINNVAQQAIQRADNLPTGMQQQIVIDIRGQTVTDAQMSTIVRGIVQKSNGIISPGAIQFK
jgi:filamentous hemagglutinin